MGGGDPVSWPDMMTPWAPAPADPLRVTILAALADRALTLRDGVSRAVFCADCEPDRICADHRET